MKKRLAGIMIVAALAGGGVTVATNMASASDAGSNAPVGRTDGGSDAPEIGPTGQTGDVPPAGVTVEKGQAAETDGGSDAPEIGKTGQTGDVPPAGVTVEKGQAAKTAG